MIAGRIVLRRENCRSGIFDFCNSIGPSLPSSLVRKHGSFRGETGSPGPSGQMSANVGRMPRNRYTGPPMTLRNMRAQGVRSLSISCFLCHRGTVLSVDRWPDDVPVPSFGPRMVCTGCGIIGADARPNWQERRSREALTGRQWH